jgi:hypothetical protein
MTEVAALGRSAGLPLAEALAKAYFGATTRIPFDVSLFVSYKIP